MKKLVTITLITTMSLVLLVACVGMYKFNYLANKDGYDIDGNKIEHNQLNQVHQIQWHELHLMLKNDLNENPPIAEVTELFNSQYSIDPTQYPTQVSLTNNIYRIKVATDINFAKEDFLDRRGALLATYQVILQQVTLQQ